MATDALAAGRFGAILWVKLRGVERAAKALGIGRPGKTTAFSPSRSARAAWPSSEGPGRTGRAIQCKGD